MRIAIVGAGAVGGAIAHALTLAGADPTLVARGATAAAIAHDGLRVSRGGKQERSRPRVVEATGAAGIHDVVIGTLKAQDWAGALPLFEPLIGPSTIVVPAINGIPWWYFQGIGGSREGTALASVDPSGVLGAAFSARCLVGGVVYIAASRPALGALDWSGGKRLVLGEIAGPNGARVAALAAFLRGCGLDVDVAPDIRAAMWLKLMGNASFNSLSVLTLATMDPLLGDPALRAICVDVMGEILALAAATGAAPSIGIEARLAMMSGMAGVRTSTLQDFEAGRSLEIAALIEAPCEIGRLTGVATPVLETLGRLLRNAETRRDAARAA
jgi:2-dehydropantoate 2-reductase